MIKRNTEVHFNFKLEKQHLKVQRLSSPSIDSVQVSILGIANEIIAIKSTTNYHINFYIQKDNPW